jgi:uncharacterized membrane-anchored protein YitT (DUF2179 family)
MIAKHRQSSRAKVFEVFWNLLLIIIGSVLAAISINGILIPNRFVIGGVTGIALIVHHLLPRFSFGLIYLLINIPLYILAYKNVGKRFFTTAPSGWPPLPLRQPLSTSPCP